MEGPPAIVGFVIVAILITLAAMGFAVLLVIDLFLPEPRREPAQRGPVEDLFGQDAQHGPAKRERFPVFDAVVPKTLRRDVPPTEHGAVVVPLVGVDDAFNLKGELPVGPRDIKPIPTRRVKTIFTLRRREPLDLQLKDERVGGVSLDAGTAPTGSPWRRVDGESSTGDEVLERGRGQSKRHS